MPVHIGALRGPVREHESGSAQMWLEGLWRVPQEISDADQLLQVALGRFYTSR